MGLHMWLPSVFDLADDEQADRLLAAARPAIIAAQGLDRDDVIYRACEATGGYYSENYPSDAELDLDEQPVGDYRGQLLGLVGLDWQAVLQHLPDDGTQWLMPPAHARHLLAELQQRPVTVAMIEGCAFPQTPSESEIAEAVEAFQQRRRVLMALLQLAIDKDEDLHISS